MLSSILNKVDNFVIQWWTRCLTSSTVPSITWLTGDLEKMGGKVRRTMQGRRGHWMTWRQCSSRGRIPLVAGQKEDGRCILCGVIENIALLGVLAWRFRVSARDAWTFMAYLWGRLPYFFSVSGVFSSPAILM